MAQTVYNLEPPVGFHGQEYDLGTADAGDHWSAVATEDIPFGSVVVRVGGDPGRCKLPATAAEITTAGSVLGIALFDSTLPHLSSDTVAGYKSGNRVCILRVGRIRIRFENTVADLAPIYVRFAGTGTRGAIRSDADTANAALLASSIAFRGATAGNLGLVELSRRGV